MGSSDQPNELQTVTSESLLAGLRADDQTRWRDYVDRYRPLIVSFAQTRGLDAEEAEDFAQTALFEFAQAYRAGRYDAAKGRLGSWSFGIVFRQLQNFWRTKRARTPAAELRTEHLTQLVDEDELEARWEDEWRNAVLTQSFREIRRIVAPQTFRAFTEFQPRPVG